jgi:hypothetical protein
MPCSAQAVAAGAQQPVSMPFLLTPLQLVLLLRACPPCAALGHALLRLALQPGVPVVAMHTTLRMQPGVPVVAMHTTLAHAAWHPRAAMHAAAAHLCACTALHLRERQPFPGRLRPAGQGQRGRGDAAMHCMHARRGSGDRALPCMQVDGEAALRCAGEGPVAYLSSPLLLALQLQDVTFRRHQLVQVTLHAAPAGGALH